MARNKSILLSEDEKRDLKKAAEQLFGTTDVANGAVVSALIERVLEDEQDENESDFADKFADVDTDQSWKEIRKELS
ncbi:hypothetical protein M0R89_14415 [Halorussus limi]|uniref:Uncharacterized protein n=1 Tax=Halorussus limi TaxID=2938695 RepID=A0A8U0HS74_9EURY|nr:hypothetical protein [Halorussus limi]UPV73727.1 hypothetical protein M0R89_14415 [Halorussus limi]